VSEQEGTSKKGTANWGMEDGTCHCQPAVVQLQVNRSLEC